MKYLIHTAVSLLLAMSSMGRGDDAIQLSFTKTPVAVVFEFYGSLSTNTAFVAATASDLSQNLTIQTDKNMDRASIKRLIEDELDKQLGLKIQHVSLEEAMSLNPIETGGRKTILAIALPSPPNKSPAGASNEISTISLVKAPITEVKKFYEALSGTQVVFEGNLSYLNERTDVNLKVACPMTKDTALKLIDIALALQQQIKVLKEEAGQTVWLRNMRGVGPKAKPMRDEKR
jgi:hypothetical protein